MLSTPARLLFKGDAEGVQDVYYCALASIVTVILMLRKNFVRMLDGELGLGDEFAEEDTDVCGLTEERL